MGNVSNPPSCSTLVIYSLFILRNLFICFNISCFSLAVFNFYLIFGFWDLSYMSSWRSLYVKSICGCLDILELCVHFSPSPDMRNFLYLFLFFIHLFTCAHIVWVISPPCPSPPTSPPLPTSSQAEPVLPLSIILLKRRHKHNKEDKSIFCYLS
jgi:hypothetical protein